MDVGVLLLLHVWGAVDLVLLGINVRDVQILGGIHQARYHPLQLSHSCSVLSGVWRARVGQDHLYVVWVWGLVHKHESFDVWGTSVQKPLEL